MSIELFISLLTAAGLGSVFTVLAQHALQSSKEKRERNFQERKEAYLGLLQALHNAAVHPSNEASKEFAYWQLRCELVSSNEICAAIQGIVDTNDDRAQRAVAYDMLKNLIRSDLGIAKR